MKAQLPVAKIEDKIFSKLSLTGSKNTTKKLNAPSKNCLSCDKLS